METVRLKKINQTSKLEFYSIDTAAGLELPLYQTKVSAGFPSPADDYTDLKIDLNKTLIKHPSATFYVKVKGVSMSNAGIQDGDILIVDRSLEAKNNCIAVCVIDGEFTVKRVSKVKNELYLLPENKEYKPIKITEYNNFEIWGIVSYVIHKP